MANHSELFTTSPSTFNEPCPQCQANLERQASLERNNANGEMSDDENSKEDLGHLQIRYGKHGPFLGCDHYPECDYIRPLHQNDGHIIKALGVPCPECTKVDSQHHDKECIKPDEQGILNGELVLRQGRYGMFIGCSAYPACQHIESSSQPQEKPDEQWVCPECKSGHVIPRQSRFGKRFYACDAYPKCTFSINQLPVTGQCKLCGFGLLMEKKATQGSAAQVVCAKRSCGAVVDK